eukprot:CAMPEP_0197435858 /NCGR_PEP_ID=MMETSP1175-20131217/3366_1 /TAXON_ID=1003142 /ORGANISM="Triceratium dubium, Strain CCMP147" /LENGTH=72 /DNA_ID=CAMNT_0042964991 /DNA_START=99 /DNA_END=317 /DNA_ORIENTATION=-
MSVCLVVASTSPAVPAAAADDFVLPLRSLIGGIGRGLLLLGMHRTASAKHLEELTGTWRVKTVTPIHCALQV